jgi:hypothetical protein
MTVKMAFIRARSVGMHRLGANPHSVSIFPVLFKTFLNIQKLINVDISTVKMEAG